MSLRVGPVWVGVFAKLVPLENELTVSGPSRSRLAGGSPPNASRRLADCAVCGSSHTNFSINPKYIDSSSSFPEFDMDLHAFEKKREGSLVIDCTELAVEGISCAVMTTALAVSLGGTSCSLRSVEARLRGGSDVSRMFEINLKAALAWKTE